MPNRNPVKQMFITYPKSTCDKQEFRDKLLKFEPDYYKIVEEKHKDGTPHLHAVIRFKNKYSKAHMLKYFKEVYPNDYKRIDVEAVRSIKNAIKYLSKEDTEPLESGEYKDGRNPEQANRTRFARECGYNNVEDMLSDYKKKLDYREKIKPLVHERMLEIAKYGNVLLTYETKKIIEKLFGDNHIMKDDMTKMLKELNIKE